MSNMKSMEYNYISKRPTQNEQEDINPCEITINIQTSENTMENLTLTTNDDIDEKTKKARIKKLQSLQKKNTSARFREYKKKEFICWEI